MKINYIVSLISCKVEFKAGANLYPTHNLSRVIVAESSSVIRSVFSSGDDRNILQVYVAGRPVAGTTFVSSQFSCKRKSGIDIEFK